MKSVEMTLPGLQKKVDVRNLKVKEVDMMTNRQKMVSGEGLDELLKSCMLGTVGIDPCHMLEGDRNAVMIGVRRATFGDMYDFKTPCPHCEEENIYEVDLSKFEALKGNTEHVKATYEWIAKNATLQDKSKEKRDHANVEPLLPCKLPGGITIHYRFASATDHKKLLKGMKGNAGKSATIKLLLKIKKADELPQGAPLKAWIPEMDWDDLEAFNDHYLENAPGIDDKIILTCDNGLCGEEFETKLEIKTENFFKRSSRKKTS